MENIYKIGVVGEESVIKGFLSLGFMIRSVTNAMQAMDAIEDLKNESCAVVYVTGNFYEKIDAEKYKTDPVFTVIPIPTPNDNSTLGENRLKRYVEKAVGADILFNK